MLQIKLIAILLTVIGLGSAGYYIVKLIGDNAVLVATLDSTTQALSDYATTAESEIEAYSHAAQILSEKYQLARDERDEKIKRITQADLSSMVERHPDMLASRINAATRRVFSELEAITRSPETAGDAEPATP